VEEKKMSLGGVEKEAGKRERKKSFVFAEKKNPKNE
jgi:hypothetical protein